MTEISLTTYGAENFPSTSKGCGDGLETLLDSFWPEQLDFLNTPLETEPTSPGSTKSATSLDFLFPTAYEAGAFLSERTISPTKDPELEEAIAHLWPPSLKVKLTNTTQTVGEGELIQDLVDGERCSESTDGLEVQLASADTAWTAAVELPSKLTLTPTQA